MLNKCRTYTMCRVFLFVKNDKKRPPLENWIQQPCRSIWPSFCVFLINTVSQSNLFFWLAFRFLFSVTKPFCCFRCVVRLYDSLIWLGYDYFLHQWYRHSLSASAHTIRPLLHQRSTAKIDPQNRLTITALLCSPFLGHISWTICIEPQPKLLWAC